MLLLMIRMQIAISEFEALVVLPWSMQTFLPLPSFQLSARVLDYRRLGKQRVEAMQILDVLTGLKPQSRWRNHPAVRMWKGYETSLMLYKDACIQEWIARGYRNTMSLSNISTARMPPWLGDHGFHAAHRSNLLRKAPQHYAQFGWSEPDDLPYVWPI